MASLADFHSAYAVNRMTSGEGECALAALRTSSPSPSGILRSVTTRSNTSPARRAPPDSGPPPVGPPQIVPHGLQPSPAEPRRRGRGAVGLDHAMAPLAQEQRQGAPHR